MKRNSKKKLIALLCTFALGSANVEKSWAMFNGFLAGNKPVGFVNCPSNVDKYYRMWQEGIKKIYGGFYQRVQNLTGCTVEIIDSDEFAKRDFYFDDPDRFKNFSIFKYKHDIFKQSNYCQLKDSLFGSFVKAGLARHSNNRVNNGCKVSSNQNLAIFLPNKFAKKTLYDMIVSLSFNEYITFKNTGKVFLKDNFIPTIPVKSLDEIKKAKVADQYFKELGLPVTRCLCDQFQAVKDFAFESLSGTCPGFLVVTYFGSKDEFKSLRISMECSKEINDLKKEIVVEYLKELSALNPGVSVKDLCSDGQINVFGYVYIKKSKIEALKKFAISYLLELLIFKDEKKESNESFYPVSEVAYQIWVETRPIVERAYRKSVKGVSDLVDVALTPLIVFGAWKSSDYFYSYIGRKILQGGAYTSEFLKSRNKLLDDPKRLKEAVSKMMKEGVVGLDDTIESLTNLVVGRIAMSKMTDVFNKTHCQLITFIGPPGTGKSLLANKFSLALTGKPLPSWGYLTSSSIRPGVPVVDQIFDANSPLVKFVIRCNGKTVLFFDEIDKYFSKALLEKFRDAIDSGTMEVTSKEKVTEVDGFGKNKSYEIIQTKKINISGLIVIFGTNEKPECWGLPPDDPNDPAENVGRTVVERDGSMVQRFLKFKFHSFKKPDYKKMYENAFKSIVKDSKKIFGFEIVCEDNLLDKLAEESCYRMQGGRSVAVILNEMAGAVTSFDMKEDTEKYETGILAKIRKIVKKRKPKVQRVKVKFNSDTHKFEIEQIFDNSDYLPPIEEVPEKDDDKEVNNQEIDKQEINNEVNSDILDQHGDQQNKDDQEMNNQKLNNQVVNNEVNSDIPDQHDDQQNKDNQEVNNEVVNNEVDDNMLNKQGEQQEVNIEPIEHQEDESENQKLENDQEFDNRSINNDSANNQYESDQEEAYYDSDYENDKKPINLEDNREEIIAD